MKMLTTIIVIVLPLFVSAQRFQVKRNSSTHDYPSGVDSRLFKSNLMESLKGSPFVTTSFQPAFFSNFKKTLLVRYDAFQERMQLKMPGDTVMNLIPQVDYEARESDKIIHFLPNLEYQIIVNETNKTYVPITYPDRKRNLKSFGVLLWQNKDGIQLIKREKKVVDAIYSLKLTNLIEKYYLVDTQKELIQLLPEKKSELFEAFFDNDTRVLAKKEKLKPRKEEDLIKLFEMYYGE